MRCPANGAPCDCDINSAITCPAPKVKIVTSFGTLMYYASKMGRAEQNGDTEGFAYWKKKHDAYQAACLASDEMVIGTYGDTYHL